MAEAFKRLHTDGLIYRGSYMVNWAPTLQTAVSDLEVEYTEETGKLFFFRFGANSALPVHRSRLPSFPRARLTESTSARLCPSQRLLSGRLRCSCLSQVPARRLRH